MMGGKAAESLFYGNDFVSLGAIQDLQQANSLAKRMIGNFGMGEKLEVFFNEDIGDDSFGKTMIFGDKYSQHTKYMMDKESLELVKEAYHEAKTILSAKIDKLFKFSELLQNNTILYGKNFEYL
jgi:cell division protease FtsH